MLQSIERQAGLPIAFDPATNAIHWPESVAVGATTIRTTAQMREYLEEPDAQPTQDTIYTVYRSVARREDSERLAQSGLRYDLTVIPPGSFAGRAREFFRTAGHYHAPGGAEAGPPEVYEVISGRAYWLIQHASAGNQAALEAVYLVEAGPGEKAVIPPGFGHISVNARPEPLILANAIAADVTYDYEPYRRLRGGGYRIVEGELPNTIEFVPNRRYERVPELVKLRPRELPALGIVRSQPLYALAASPSALEFLKHPESSIDALAIDRCYHRAV